MNSGKWISIIGSVRAQAIIGRPPRQRFVMTLGDETGTAQLVFFRSVNYFKGAYAQGETLAVSGKVTGYGGRPQFAHPSIDRLNVGDEEDPGFLHTKGLVPKYGSSEDLRGVNLHVKGLRRIMRTAVDEYVRFVEEHLPADVISRNKLVPLQTALAEIHFPSDLREMENARRRLKFDELFAIQLFLAIKRKHVKIDRSGIAYTVESLLARKLVDALPFALTKAQVRVINEITGDMRSKQPMNRLLQGDVASGKTIVAVIAMLIAVENGYQAAFMAPTEILAYQHHATISQILGGLPVNMRLLVGNQRAGVREDILEEARSGRAQIVVGTHALIQENVGFDKLGIVVIDEQHRFGVTQRLALRGKGSEELHPDVLVMTATPIPRTLSLTLYGDLDVSVIDELPSNRKPVKTAIRSEAGRGSVYNFVRGEVKKGRQAYIVYPLIETSEKLDLKAATEGFELLKTKVFPGLRIGLIHGRMSPDEKEEVMSAFKSRNIDILVATTVIEVGIDIPNASIMVIEHAERFGLAQLHQLRGRVGRGAEQSYCILMAPDWMKDRSRRAPKLSLTGEEDPDEIRAVKRLKAMEKTTDGFKIAEIDLELRGPGDFFGTRQSGIPELQIANLVTDGDLLALARREAFTIIEADPHLRLPEHERLRSYVQERLKETLSLLETG
jgi:ATP-dependent DNA helicase RecG